jgi:peptidoglycan/xylan/chitin deacetylase (PgdA/CDA1 family)
MLVTPETFRLHIDTIKQVFDIIQLSEWIQIRHDAASTPARACAITFDDGWADNHEFAFPILHELRVPATIFLVSDLIGTVCMFWPERLTRIITTVARTRLDDWSHPALGWIRSARTTYRFGDCPPSPEELAQIIAHAKALPDGEIQNRLDRITQELELPSTATAPSLLNWGQVADMTRSGLVEVGSHTCRHTRLTESVQRDQLEYEIVASKRHIREKSGHPVSTFCFPNGDYSPEALALVRDHYEAAVTTQTGWNSPATDPHLLHRIGIHQDVSHDRTAFLARISGWM